MLQQSSLLNNMGFSSKSVFQCHQYSINIAELISPIYHLVVELCEHNVYARKVYHRINSIYLDDPSSNELRNCFDTRVMPIL